MKRLRIPLLPWWVRWAGVGAVAAVLLYASVLDSPGFGRPPLGPLAVVRLDKWLHFLGYAGLAGATAYALAGRLDHRLVVVAAFLVALGYGLGIEVVQLGLPARSFDLADVLANALGAGVAVVGWGALRRRMGLRRVELLPGERTGPAD